MISQTVKMSLDHRSVAQCLAAAMALFSILYSPLASATDCEMTYRWTEDPPYTYSAMDAPDGVAGISADIVRTIMRSLDCEVSFVDMPWARALAELKSGRLDMADGAFDVPERREFAHYSKHGKTFPNVLFMRAVDATSTNFESFADFLASHYTLGGQVGVNYGPDYDQAIKTGAFNDRLTLVPNRVLLWQMLDRNRIDAVAASKLTGIMEISELGFQERIVSTGIVLSSEPAYFIFSKQRVDTDFVERFDAELHELIRSGQYQRLLDAHTAQAVRSESQPAD